MAKIHFNNFKTTLVSGINNSVTSFTLADSLPSLGGSNCMLTITASGFNEIVLISSNSGAPTYTITRAQEGTSARSWLAGDKVECRITAASVDDKLDTALAQSKVDATVGTDNVRAGSGAGAALTTGGDRNTFYGKDAGLAITTSDDNVCIGHSAGKAMTSGTGLNTFIGKDAGKAATSGTSLTAIGYNAMSGVVASGANGSTAVGAGALASLTSGTANTAIGSSAGATWASSANNTAVGASAAVGNSGSENVAIGDGTMANGTGSRAKNVIIGSGAGNFATGSNTVAIGANDGTGVCGRSHGSTCVYVGSSSGTNSSGADNVAIGAGAMADGTGGASTKNVAIGSGAMKSGATGAVALTSASGNTILGYRAGVSAADCADAIAIGQDAVATKATGSTSGTFGPGISIGSAAKPVGFRGDGTIIPTTKDGSGWWKAKINGTQYYIPLFADAYSAVATPTVAAGAVTISLANGTIQKVVTAANTTITLPAAAAGANFSIIVQYGGAHTITWAGGGTLKWPAATEPVATSVNGQYDIYDFKCHDSSITFGKDGGRNF